MEWHSLTTIQELTINPNYTALTPPLAKTEFEDLLSSIREHGQFVEIIVNKDLVILDGHHRYKACKTLGIAPRIKVMEFDDPLFEKIFILDCNRARRQLTVFQKCEIQLKKKALLSQLARRHMSLGGKGSSTEEPLHVDKTLAKEIGVSTATLYRADEILKAGSDYLIQQARKPNAKIRAVYNDLERAKYREKAIAEAEQHALESSPNCDGRMKLVCKPFQEADEADESVDLILSDPPYTADSLTIYADLAKLAMRKLKPGGSCVLYAGHHMIFEIGDVLRAAGLKPWWVFALWHSGASATVYGRQVMVGWKPLLHFVKGEKPACKEFMSDRLDMTKPPAKLAHDWEQGVDEARYIVEHLTYNNQIVADYTAGSGTTGIAALSAGRYFIGYEIDSTNFAIMQSRITKYLGSQGDS